jgi:aspartokinase/homoserine dehydrogenase 1
VDGVFSVNPELVEDARHIENLSFQEANEMVNFGMNVLHDKTILPLIDKNIPLKILNTFKGIDQTGTLISNDKNNTCKISDAAGKQITCSFRRTGITGKSRN